jgi:hypothetical protein
VPTGEIDRELRITGRIDGSVPEVVIETCRRSPAETRDIFTTAGTPSSVQLQFLECLIDALQAEGKLLRERTGDVSLWAPPPEPGT